MVVLDSFYLRQVVSYTVLIVWELTLVDSALVVLDEWSSYRGGRLNRFCCVYPRFSRAEFFIKLSWLVGLKRIQLEQQKTQLPFINLAKKVKTNLKKERKKEKADTILISDHLSCTAENFEAML